MSKGDPTSPTRGDIVETIIDTVDGSGERLANDTLKRMKTALRTHHEGSRTFEKVLRRRWGSALDMMELLIQMAHEIGDEFNSRYRPDAHHANDYSFEVLTHLHGRGCRVSREIHALLRYGYPSGALARWRALHEVTVVANLIRMHGGDVAERYLRHVDIEDSRAVVEYQKHSTKLGHSPYTELEVAQAVARKEALLKEYGSEFGKPYGWASDILKTSDPKFAEIEEKAGLSHMRPYYRFASHDIHCGPMGIRRNVGMPDDSWRTLVLAGATNLGFADPGQLTALSLYQTTACLVTTRNEVEFLVGIKALDVIRERTVQEFVRIQTEQERQMKLMPTPIVHVSGRKLFKWSGQQ